MNTATSDNKRIRSIDIESFTPRMSDERTILWHPPPRLRIIIILLSLIFFSTVLADTPSDNDIPTLAMRILGSNLFDKDITLELLCELSWLNFDAVNFTGTAAHDHFKILMSLCDSAGVYYSICPFEVMQYFMPWADTTYRYWFRNSDSTFTSDHCFAQSDEDYTSLVNSATAEAMYEDSSFSINTTIEGLAESTEDSDFLWFYEVYDEASSKQWLHAVRNDDPWDDYIPNVYTQDTRSGDTLSLEEVEPSGIFSIQKYYAENDSANPVPFTLNYGLLHTIKQDEYTGLAGDIVYGTMADQATSIRAMMEAEYQPLREANLYPNSPDFIMFDYYPFRYVHPDSALANSGPAKMCDADWLFLIDHFEEGIDSTVIPAHEYNCPGCYFPQTFGKSGGPGMYSEGSLDYQSYYHRKPAPQEFRMLCNLALMHQAKGIFPYNLTSYLEFDEDGDPCIIMSSLLDLHNIPFDAPYEEWVYTGRWPDSTLKYVRPNLIPPWIAGYDPLYTLPAPPPLSVPPDPKYDEEYYEWLFEPHAELYNNLGGILADVKWIGPEMHDLWWCEENGTAYWDVAEITAPDSELVNNYVSPVIKVFQKSGSDHPYLYYVNRYCRGEELAVHIVIDDLECPGTVRNNAIDHSRRCMIPVDDNCHTVYYFDDTLEAGEGRLIEFVRRTVPADIQVTSPDVFCSFINSNVRFTELCCKAGQSIDIGATFYNMGTSSTGNVTVTFTDHSGILPTIIGSDVINLGGLSQDYQPDSTSAVITWNTDSDDIGVHVIEISAATILGEDSFDNTVWATVLVEPRDYATYVRGNAWDMTEGGSNDWHTDDIEAIAENWNTSTGWTDSVSGMFEGLINYNVTEDHFIGEISLAIPDVYAQYIDTEKYHMLSFGITVNNPNTHIDNACDMQIGWRDAIGQWSGYTGLLGSTDYHVGNGWDSWSVIGPIDLNSIPDLYWGNGGVASELWLLFKRSGTIVLPPEPVDIRIGWIRLEESAP